MDTVEIIKNANRKFTDEELTQMAIEELNREMVKAKARVEVGRNRSIPPCPLKKTNKRFLNNTLRNALTFNKRQGQSTRIKSMKKLYQADHGERSTTTTSTNQDKSSPSKSCRSHSASPPNKREQNDPDVVIELD